MNAYARPRQDFNRSLEEGVASVKRALQAEILQAVGYVDAVVVPQVRRESSVVLRQLAGHLERIANNLHHEDGPGNSRS